MVSVLPSNVVDRGFDSRAGQIKDYKTDICSNIAYLVRDGLKPIDLIAPN
jgi:hypothetical protein